MQVQAAFVFSGHLRGCGCCSAARDAAMDCSIHSLIHPQQLFSESRPGCIAWEPLAVNLYAQDLKIKGRWLVVQALVGGALLRRSSTVMSVVSECCFVRWYGLSKNWYLGTSTHARHN